MASDPTAPSAPPRSLWISRPWIDLAIGCAGWSLPLLAIAYQLTGPAALALSTTFYSLALVVNYPHYMATVYRAYAGGEWRRYPAYTVWATIALVAIGAAAHVETTLIPILFTAYVMWSPWHYSGQNYGLMIMFAKRGGHQLIAPAAAAPQVGVLRVVLDAARLVQHRPVVGSARALAGTAGCIGAADRQCGGRGVRARRRRGRHCPDQTAARRGRDASARPAADTGVVVCGTGGGQH